MMAFSVYAQDAQWESVMGADTLRDFMVGLKAERKLPSGKKQSVEYQADGTGILHAWGGSFTRAWDVTGDNQIGYTVGNERQCVRLEKSTSDSTLYRVKDVSNNQYHEFTVTSKTAVAEGKPGETGNKGGTAAVSAEEVARELANPNSPLATLNFKLQYRSFDGDLPNADDQSSTTLLFQPAFPFELDNGDIIFFRPAIPILLDQPFFDSTSSDFGSESGLGNIAFDLAYGRTTDKGMIYAAGVVSSIPTATNDRLGNDRWTLGPEFIIGKITKKYVLGVFPSHQWDVAGSGDEDVNRTNLQMFAVYLPGGGWNIGSSPTMSYNHENNEALIPLNLTIGKTMILEGRPWKLAVELNYYVENPDSFAPEWFIGINVAPVVENVFAGWFK
jgi:hypothetical protein